MDLQDYEFYMQLFKRSRKKDGMTGAEIKKHYINAFHYSVSQPAINKHLQDYRSKKSSGAFLPTENKKYLTWQFLISKQQKPAR